MGERRDEGFPAVVVRLLGLVLIWCDGRKAKHGGTCYKPRPVLRYLLCVCVCVVLIVRIFRRREQGVHP